MTRLVGPAPTPGCSLPPSDHQAVPEPPGSEPSPLLPLRVPVTVSPEAWRVAARPCAPQSNCLQPGPCSGPEPGEPRPHGPLLPASGPNPEPEPWALQPTALCVRGTPHEQEGGQPTGTLPTGLLPPKSEASFTRQHF